MIEQSRESMSLKKMMTGSMLGKSQTLQPTEEFSYDSSSFSYSGVETKPTQMEHIFEGAHSGKEATCIRFNAQGTLLATGGVDCTVKIWDCQQSSTSFECIDTVKIFQKPLSALAFSHNGEYLGGVSFDR